MKDFEAKDVLFGFLIKAGYDVLPTARLSHLARKFGHEFEDIAEKVNPDRMPWHRQRALALAEFIAGNPPVVHRRRKPKADGTVTKSQKLSFFQSWEWLRLRKEVLNKSGFACQCCGARPGDDSPSGPVRIEVDHVHPVSKRWDLRLDPDNLQVLCKDCNKGKGAWDRTDHRVN